MAIAWILLFKKIKAEGKFYQKVLLPVSKASYDMYLMHLLILVPISGAIRNALGSGADGRLGFWTTPVEIILSSILAFIGTAVAAIAITHIFKTLKTKLLK
jgi:peptidoglycan/LPS O-acetylase OafA/YrhL